MRDKKDSVSTSLIVNRATVVGLVTLDIYDDGGIPLRSAGAMQRFTDLVEIRCR